MHSIQPGPSSPVHQRLPSGNQVPERSPCLPTQAHSRRSPECDALIELASARRDARDARDVRARPAVAEPATCVADTALRSEPAHAFSLAHMPAAVLQAMASRMSCLDRIAFAASDPIIYREIRLETMAALLASQDAARVETLAEFQTVLDSDAFKALPARLRGEPLATLGTRLRSLKWSDMQAGTALFLDASGRCPEPITPLLRALREAAAGGFEGLRA